MGIVTTRERIEALALARQKIAAIKEYRTATRVGLREAKEAVEFFIAQGQWRPEEVPGASGSAAPVAASGAASSQHADPMSEVVAFIDRGAKIQAIKAYREVHRVGLKESKDAVEYFETHRAWPTEGARAALGESLEPDPGRIEAARPETVEPTKTATFGDSPLASAGLSLPGQARNGGEDRAKQEQARAALAATTGDASAPLAAVAAQCSFYGGFLFVTAQRVAFVGDRYGSWDVMEDLSRAELERVEVSSNLFGAELVVQAGFHTANFSELERDVADALERLLSGKASSFEQPTRSTAATVEAEHGRAEPAPRVDFSAVEREAGTRGAGQLPAEFSAPAPSPAATHQAQATEPDAKERASAGPARPFKLSRVIVQALIASIPALLIGSAWRVVDLDDFPTFLFLPLYWSAVALGGGFLRGHGGPMAQAGFVAGIVDYLVGELGGYFGAANGLCLAILGFAYVRARAPSRWWLGVVLLVPVLLLEHLLTSPMAALEVIAPTAGLAFWFVHFGIEDMEEQRRTQKALGTAVAK